MHNALRYILIWIPMPVLGVLNGSLRELVLKNYFSEYSAQRISAVTLVIFLFVYCQFIRKKLPLVSLGDAILCGLIWVVLTVCFEVGLGHFVFSMPYDTLLEQYNIFEGKLWPFVLFFIGLLPFILRKQNQVS